jgi:hypothetical protein
MSKWTKFIPDGQGGFDAISDWGLGHEVVYQGGWRIIFGVMFGFVFGMLFPIIAIICYPFTNTRNRIVLVSSGILVSVLFLLDYWLGGPLWMLFTASDTVEGHKWFATVGASSLVILVVLWFLTPRLGDNFDILNGGQIYFIVIGVLIYFVLYPFFDSLLESTRADYVIFFLEETFNELKS